MNPPDEPEGVRLTTDYVDTATGTRYPAGTFLARMQGGQYAPPGTKLGQGGVVAGLFLLRKLCTFRIVCDHSCETCLHCGGAEVLWCCGSFPGKRHCDDPAPTCPNCGKAGRGTYE